GVQYARAAFEIGRAPVVRHVLGLLEQLQVHRVVQVAHDDLVGVLGGQRGRHLEDVPLQHDDVGPLDGFGQVAPACGTHGERRGRGIGERVDGDQADVVFAGEHLGDVPRTNRGAGHAFGDGVTGQDQDLAAPAECAVDAEGLDEDVVGREV